MKDSNDHRNNADDRRRRGTARGPFRARAIRTDLLLLLAVGFSAEASAEPPTSRLMSMTGVWTGPPLDKDGVPLGFKLEGDIQVPIRPKDSLQAAAGPAAWADGVVPYEFDANVSALHRQYMLETMDEIMKGGNANKIHIAFVPRSGQAQYIHISDSTGNNSPVGMGTAGTTVNIYDWLTLAMMAHELAHTLGLWHEQSRPDRDTYVTIHLENVEAGKEHNFNKVSDWLYNTTGTPYDFDSMMHYGANAFSANGSDTITVNAPYDGSGMGQRGHISANDYADLYSVPEYGGGGSGYVDYRTSGAGAGTLSNPWSGVFNGAAQNAARQNPNPRSRLWVQGGHNYSETGRLASGPQKILAIPGTGTVRIGP